MTYSQNDRYLLSEPNPVLQKRISREQFYKIRPKIPKIHKTDIRRTYAAAYADAYNSCDFDTIWDFLSSHCVRNIVFAQKWSGADQYTNFPRHLELVGKENVAEYWFSRCLLVPDLAMQLTDTKLYVRSDGLSTVASAFSIRGTRMYDGEISDAIICQTNVEGGGTPQYGLQSLFPQAICDPQHGSTTDRSQSGPDDTIRLSSSDRQDDDEEAAEEEDAERAEIIYQRALAKADAVIKQNLIPQVLKKSVLSRASRVPVHSSKKRRKLENPNPVPTLPPSMSSMSLSTTPQQAEGIPMVTPFNNQQSQSQSQPFFPPGSRKRLPTDRSLDFTGSFTMQLNTDCKIHRVEITFALASSIPST